MEYCIYCDESCHLENDGIVPMAIGCVWCEKERKADLYKELRAIKVKHGLPPHCELKWNGVSPSKIDYFKDVVKFFFGCDDLHFRVLVVPDKKKVLRSGGIDFQDDLYYKLYFDLLKTVIDPDDSYEVYLDIKDTQSQKKIEMLRNSLNNERYDFDQSIIRKIQQVKSSDSELVELSDFLTGAVCYLHRINGGEQLLSTAKRSIIDMIAECSGYSLLKSTLYKEDKMNIFIWRGLR